MYQRFNISLRLPAHLFVEKDCEEMVVEKIKECYSKINTSWTLKFAMDTNLIDAKPVVDFAKRHDKLFKHRTSFKPSDSINDSNTSKKVQVPVINFFNNKESQIQDDVIDVTPEDEQ